jgi:aprataxin
MISYVNEMANLTILRTYALRGLESLPKSILYSHTDSALVIFDAYPKSIFHFLVLPRVRDPFTPEDLANLHSLSRKDLTLAKEVIQGLATAAESLKKDIEEEMIKRYGFKWNIWTGFHGAPSMTCVQRAV